jgi:hypothetical protein
MHLYKYLPSVFSQALLKRGSVRIGTLSDFRRSEHKSGISDPSEGTKVVNLDIVEEEKYDYLTEAPEALQGFIEINGVCKNLTLNHIHTATRYISQDVYIYCLSSERSITVLESLEGAEICLELLYQEEFFRDLNRIMSLVFKSTFEGLFECTYQDRFENLSSGHDPIGLDPSIIKEPQFSDQKEIRAIWRPNNKETIQPITINSPHLGAYFRNVDITNYFN